MNTQSGSSHAEVTYFYARSFSLASTTHENKEYNTALAQSPCHDDTYSRIIRITALPEKKTPNTGPPFVATYSDVTAVQNQALVLRNPFDIENLNRYSNRVISPYRVLVSLFGFRESL